MFSNVVESLLRNAGAPLLTEVFILIMFCVFILALVLNYFGAWKSFTAYTATLLTSLGILGTFAGVVTGLLDFDSSVEQIDTSIGSLLEGLKTAFTSSLVGMALSIMYKVLILVPFLQASKSNLPDEGVTVESLYEVGIEQARYLHGIAKAMAGKEGTSVLKQLAYVCESHEWMQNQMELIHSDQKKASEEQRVLLEKTLTVLSDDGESSLTGQLKLVRADANDVGKVISSALEKAVAKMDEQLEFSVQWRPEQKTILESTFEQLNAVRLDAVNHSNESSEQRMSMVTLLERSPTEALITALEGVIRDFNDKLTEQFGKNFEQLNVAVGRMVDWQENYRHQITELQNAFDMSVTSIKNCENSMNSIEQNSGAIPTHMEVLAEVLEVSRFQLSGLEDHLQAFADVKQSAVESMPKLHELVENVTIQFASSTQQMINECEASNQSFAQAMHNSATGLTESSSQVTHHLTEAAERTGAELQGMLDGLRRSIEEQFKNSTESVETLITKEFQDMENVRMVQVENIMREMGTALSSITGQFTRDYQSLVGAMNDVVKSGDQRGV